MNYHKTFYGKILTCFVAAAFLFTSTVQAAMISPAQPDSSNNSDSLNTSSETPSQGSIILARNKNFISALNGGQTPIPTTTRYVGSLYEEKGTSQGTEKTRHIYLGSRRVASVIQDNTGSRTSYYHGDHLDSTNVVTDENGQVKELVEYVPFGGMSRHEVYAGSTNHYFTGKELDETGLYYYGARYYNPTIGRFITPDSMVQAPGNPQTLNRYTYANNNPVVLTDPNGHWFWIALIVGAILGGASAAANDQPIWKGVLFGALGGVMVGAGTAAWGFWGAVGGGMLSGAANAGGFGGDVGLGILTGGLGAGLGYGLGSWAQGWNDFSSWGEIGAGAFSGAITGGVGSELQGGKFGDGAWRGASFGTAGSVAAKAVGSLDPRIRNARKYEQEVKKMHNLNVNKSDKVKISGGARPVGNSIANHKFIDGFEMGPVTNKGGAITTTNTAGSVGKWDTFLNTQDAIGAGTVKPFSAEVSFSGMVDAIDLYNNYWAGDTTYSPISYNSNYAVNTVIYAAGGSVPGGLGWAPAFNTLPASVNNPYYGKEK